MKLKLIMRGRAEPLLYSGAPLSKEMKDKLNKWLSKRKEIDPNKLNPLQFANYIEDYNNKLKDDQGFVCVGDNMYEKNGYVYLKGESEMAKHLLLANFISITALKNGEEIEFKTQIYFDNGEQAFQFTPKGKDDGQR